MADSRPRIPAPRRLPLRIGHPPANPASKRFVHIAHPSSTTMAAIAVGRLHGLPVRGIPVTGYPGHRSAAVRLGYTAPGAAVSGPVCNSARPGPRCATDYKSSLNDVTVQATQCIKGRDSNLPFGPSPFPRRVLISPLSSVSTSALLRFEAGFSWSAAAIRRSARSSECWLAFSRQRPAAFSATKVCDRQRSVPASTAARVGAHQAVISRTSSRCGCGRHPDVFDAPAACRSQ